MNVNAQIIDIVDAIKDGEEKISIPGFGLFEIVPTGPRTKGIRFRPSSDLHQALQNLSD